MKMNPLQRILLIALSIWSIDQQLIGQQVFHVENQAIQYRVNDGPLNTWNISPDLNPDVLNAACSEAVNTVWFVDKNDSISFEIKEGDVVDFLVMHPALDTAYTRIVGVPPNAVFTQEYIDRYRDKFIVEIKEVSELVNILVALHQDMGVDSNIVDMRTDYYQEVREYFAPYLDHPMMDTIHQYITGLHEMEGMNYQVFSTESYYYYYRLKMNACAYHFNAAGEIVNEGYIKRLAGGDAALDPMRDAALMADFAKKSNFRQFYHDHKPYYEELISVYRQLNPIDQMQKWLEQKYGFAYGNYTVYFSPLIGGAHSTGRASDKGFEQTFMFISAAEVNDKYSLVQNELFESRVVFTEIDHNFVNLVSNKFLDQIEPIFTNREKWAPKENSSMYSTPFSVFNEYMTFGVYSLYVDDHFSEKELETFLPYMEKSMCEGRGFVEFRSFNREILRKYRENRDISMEALCQHMLDWSSRH